MSADQPPERENEGLDREDDRQSDEESPVGRASPPDPDDDAALPEVEDATDQPPPAVITPEENPEPITHAARAMDGGAESAEPPEPHPVDERIVHPDETTDVGELDEDWPEISEAERLARGRARWDVEPEIQRIAAELRGIEADVRGLLEGRDTKRKRRFAGTRRWLELQEDVAALRHAGRMPEQSLDEITRLVTRRHHLFRRLHYLSGTRPAWNT